MAALTGGTDAEIVGVLARYCDELRTTPAAVRFNIATWDKQAPTPALDVIRDLDGAIDREDLRRLSGEAIDGRGRLNLFVAALVWGLGKRNARLLPGFRKALGHPNLVATLRTTADLVRKGRPGDAYVRWAEANIPGLGEAFFTKWLYAVGLHGVEPLALQPLVLDGNVWRSLRRLGWSSERASGFRYRDTPAAGYCAYLAACRRWAHALAEPCGCVTAEAVEHWFFVRNGRIER